MFKTIVSVIFLTAALTGCGADPDPGGGLLISSKQTGNWEVFAFHPKSSIVLQVTHEAGYVVDYDMLNPDEVAAEVEGFDFEPTWSPDGKRIVLVSDRYGIHELLIVDLHGSVLNKLTGAGPGVGEPAWSPDGTQIAFRGDYTEDRDVELFVMDADGSNVRQLTHSPGEDWTPTWSPDGTLLAFASRRGNGSWDLFTMRKDGSEIAQLTSDEWDNYLPDWSPDGNQIAFSSNRNGNWDIFTMNLDGTAVRQLSDHPMPDIEPVWSPDGKSLAFASSRTGTRGWEIFFVEVESGQISGSGQAGYPTDWFGEIEDSG